MLSYLAARPSLEPRPCQVFILVFFLCFFFFCFFFFARLTDPASQETGQWETKHFIGMA